MADSPLLDNPVFWSEMIKILAMPFDCPGPYPNQVNEIVRGFCASLEISEAELWARINFYCHPTAPGLN